jgi:hypothetical protein
VVDVTEICDCGISQQGNLHFYSKLKLENVNRFYGAILLRFDVFSLLDTRLLFRDLGIRLSGCGILKRVFLQKFSLGILQVYVVLQFTVILSSAVVTIILLWFDRSLSVLMTDLEYIARCKAEDTYWTSKSNLCHCV